MEENAIPTEIADTFSMASRMQKSSISLIIAMLLHPAAHCLATILAATEEVWGPRQDSAVDSGQETLWGKRERAGCPQGSPPSIPSSLAP